MQLMRMAMVKFWPGERIVQGAVVARDQDEIRKYSQEGYVPVAEKPALYSSVAAWNEFGAKQQPLPATVSVFAAFTSVGDLTGLTVLVSGSSDERYVLASEMFHLIAVRPVGYTASKGWREFGGARLEVEAN